MAEWSIKALPATDVASMEAVIDLLRDHNAPFLGRPAVQPFQLVVEHGGGIAGGLLGEFRSHWLHIDILVIAPALRGQGIGSELIRRAEAAARSHGSHGLWLDTFEFQAPAFYKRLGFKRFGVIENFHAGQARYFLEKRL